MQLLPRTSLVVFEWRRCRFASCVYVSLMCILFFFFTSMDLFACSIRLSHRDAESSDSLNPFLPKSCSLLRFEYNPIRHL